MVVGGRRRVAALLAVALSVGACTMWAPTTMPVPALVEQRHPGSIRVTLTDGSRHEIRHPMVAGDSIVRGDTAGTHPSRGNTQQIFVRDVTAVDVREFSGVKTAVLVITVPMVVAYVAVCGIEGCPAD